ncbi:hypothetical protein NGA_0717200, partial [Nannochloropsis gaditana CCMP526]|uniref:uncharacterized protein n=1 Tax=Nannochloropsis gaditana (strain CCMP526) TaxID=1093141 RepID=UPI00029F65CA
MSRQRLLLVLSLCRRHLSDDKKWLYQPQSQRLIEARSRSPLVLHGGMIQGGRGREGEEAQQELVEKSLPAAASRKSFSCSQISTSSSSPSSIPSSSPSSSPLRLVYCPASCFFTHPATFTVLACAENSDEWSLPL